MTEQQAIKIINEEKSWESDDRKIDAFIMAVDALEEIHHYRELERKLNGVDLIMLVNTFMEKAAEGEIHGYQRGRILTNEDADKWDAYLATGTPEEFRKCMDILTKSEVNELSKIIDEWLLYHKLGTPEECQAAADKQKAKKPSEQSCEEKTLFKCRNCGYIMKTKYSDGPVFGHIQNYCEQCGQKMDWSNKK